MRSVLIFCLLRCPLVNRFFYNPAIKKEFYKVVKPEVKLFYISWFTACRTPIGLKLYFECVFPKKYNSYDSPNDNRLRNTNGHLIISDELKLISITASHEGILRDLDSEFEDIIKGVA